MQRLGYAKGIYDQKEKDAVMRSLDSGWLSGGAETVGFEKEFAEWWGVQKALAVNSGSNANFIALQSLGLPKNSEIITPAGGAFPTTVAPMVYLGFTPVFIDVKGLVIDVDKIEEAITPKTSAIVFAHTIGQMPNMKKLMKIARDHNLKVLEDCCFPAETKIKVKGGYKNIENIKVGDLVLTRKGYKKVLRSWKTGNKKVIDNFGIVATPDHQIITKNGVKRLDKLTASDIIYIWNEKLSSITEKNITDTQVQNYDKEGCIFTDIVKSPLFHFIDKFGLTTLEKYLKVKLFTIKTITHLITTLQTLNVLQKKNTQKNILQKKEKLLLEKILKLHDKKLQNGTDQKKELNFIVKLENCLGKIRNSIIRFVRYVERNIKHITQKDQNIVQKNVNQKVAVYNLTVEGCHEFFANNVLVHNCDAVGSAYKGRRAGTWGDVATVSFYPAHHMTTGEGGMILTNNTKTYYEAMSIRDWGRDCTCHFGGDNPICKNRYFIEGFDHRYYYTRIGLNCKMTEMQAAFGREQLKRLDGFIEVRRRNYNILAKALGEPECGEISPFCYPVWSKNKKRDCKLIEEAGIETRYMFAGNILNHPAYKSIHSYVHDLTESDRIFNEVYFVGVAPHLTEENMLYIAGEIKKCRALTS